MADVQTANSSTHVLTRLHAALNPGRVRERAMLNADYMLSMDCKRLMYNYYIQAGLNTNRDTLPERYGGWEDPSFQTRGSFTGHYLSACALYYRNEGDERFKSLCDTLVSELARCQAESDEDWCCAIPPEYVRGIVRGKYAWAPQYMVHKTMMGLVDAYLYAGNKQALEVAGRWALWFERFTANLDDTALNIMTNYESGGLMETWAQLYSITGDEMYRRLSERYLRKSIFDPLLEGRDALTMIHANTSIPESHGPAMLYEATDEDIWRRYTEAFWNCAVDGRPWYCTGGQSYAEVWTGADLNATLGERNEEHCTVYNMIRLADYLFRWSGDIKYAQFIERSLLNAIPAHQNRTNNAITYFLPLGRDVKKEWTLPHEGMFCCAGTLVQAQASYGCHVFYGQADGVTVAQYISAHTMFGASRHISMHVHDVYDSADGVYVKKAQIDMSGGGEHFTLRLRIPDWCPDAYIMRGDRRITCPAAGEWMEIADTWANETMFLIMPMRLRTEALAGSDTRHAVLCGPHVLAAVDCGDPCVNADPVNPADTVKPYNSFVGSHFTLKFATTGQPQNFVLVPLSEITDERYTTYLDFKNSIYNCLPTK